MEPTYGAVLLALINSNPDAFAAACKEAAPDDPETLSNSILDWLAEEASETVEEEDAEDAATKGATA